LQQEASRKLGLSADQTMRLAQQLHKERTIANILTKTREGNAL
jgi:DNA topoisomerase IA